MADLAHTIDMQVLTFQQTASKIHFFTEQYNQQMKEILFSETVTDFMSEIHILDEQIQVQTFMHMLDDTLFIGKVKKLNFDITVAKWYGTDLFPALLLHYLQTPYVIQTVQAGVLRCPRACPAFPASHI